MAKPWPTGLAVSISGDVGVVTGTTVEYGVIFNNVKFSRGINKNNGGYLPENLVPISRHSLCVCAECDGWAFIDFLCEACRER